MMPITVLGNKKVWLLGVLLFLSFSLKAQVDITVTLLPPYSINISDLKAHPERIVAIIRNTSLAAINVQLRGGLIGDNGVSIKVKKSYKSGSPLRLGANEVQTLNGNDLSALFDYDAIAVEGTTLAKLQTTPYLPEGNYQVCVQAYDYYTNALLLNSGSTGCSNFFPAYLLETPTILQPFDDNVITPLASQSFPITWSTPAGAPPSTLYTVKMVEILDDRSPQNAMYSATSPAFFEQTVMGNVILYGPAMPVLTLGRRYALMVTARDPTNTVAIRNNGQSEIIGFTYGVLNGELALNALVNGLRARAKLDIYNVDDPSTHFLVTSDSLPAWRWGNKPGQYAYTITSTGVDVVRFVTQTGGFTLQPGATTTLNLNLVDAVKIYGTIRNAGNVPLDSAIVTFDGPLANSVTTNSNGEYLIYVPRDQALALRATRRGYAKGSKTINTVVIPRLAGVDIALADPYGSLAIDALVNNQRTRAILDIYNVADPATHFSVTSDSLPTWRWNNTAGKYIYTITPVDSDPIRFVTQKGEFSLVTDSTTTVSLNLVDAVKIYGTITNADKVPLDSVNITFDGPSSYSVTASADGYRIYVPRNQALTLRASKKSYDGASKVVNTAAIPRLTGVNFSLQYRDPNIGLMAGTVQWLYLQSELPANENTAYALGGATIRVYGSAQTTADTVGDVLLASTTSSQDGTYSIKLNKLTARGYKSVYLLVTHPSGALSALQSNITGYVNDTAISYTSTSRLTVNSIRFTATVVCPQYQPGDNIKVSILMRKDLWARYAFWGSALGSPQEETYNGQAYLLVANMLPDVQYNRLVQNMGTDERYLVRINYNNRPAYYVAMTSGQVIGTLRTDGGRNPYNLGKNYKYNITNTLSGIVSLYQSGPRANVKVTATLNMDDVLDTSKTVTSYSAVTNSAGSYQFTLPRLKNGAVINMLVSDKTISTEASFIDTAINNDQASITKDILIKNFIYTVTGVLKNAAGQPLANALVTINESGEQTRTTDNGFYILRVPSSSSSIKFTANGYADASFPITRAVVTLNLTGSYNSAWVTQWAAALTGSAALKPYLQSINISATQWPMALVKVNEAGNNSDYYNNQALAGKIIKGVFDMGNNVVLQPLPGDLAINLLVNGARVNGMLSITRVSDGATFSSKAANDTSDWHWLGNAGSYRYTIAPIVSADVRFVPQSGEFKLSSGYTTTLNLKLKDGVKVSGTITNTKNNPLPGAVVSFSGRYGYAVTADDNGAYTIYLPSSGSYTLTADKDDYSSDSLRVNATAIERSLYSQNIKLKYFDTTLPKIATLAGFPVAITQKYMKDGKLYLSGAIKITANNVYAPVVPTELAFENVNIYMDASNNTNAKPYADIVFANPQIVSTALNFATVEMWGARLTNQTGTWHYYNAVIAVERLVLSNSYNSTEDLSDKIHFVGADLDLNKKDDGKYYYVYLPPGNTYPALSSADRKFTVDLWMVDQNQAYQYSTGGKMYLKYDLGNNLGTIYTEAGNGVLSGTGIKLKGMIGLPKCVQMGSFTKRSFSTFELGTDFRFANILTTDVSPGSPISASVQNMRLKITTLSVADAGSATPSLQVQGSINLKGGIYSEATEGDGILDVNNLSFPQINNQVVLAAHLTGKNKMMAYIPYFLEINFDDAKSADLTYLPDKNTYIVGASNISLTYNLATASKTVRGLSQDLFPLAASNFYITADNWDCGITVQPNVTKNIGVFAMNVSEMVLNVGQNVSEEYMAANFANGNKSSNFHGRFTDYTTTWAVALSGNMDPTAGYLNLGPKINTSVYFGVSTGALKLISPQFNVHLDNPVFKADVNVKIFYDDTTRGITGSGTLTSMDYGFAAKFKYGKYFSNNKITLSASGSIDPPDDKPIIIEATQWYKINFGFSYDEAQNKYSALFGGQFGPTKRPKDEIYFDGDVTVLFDVDKCGARPVLSCDAMEVYLKNNDLGTGKFRADFCQQFLTVQFIGKEIPLPISDKNSASNSSSPLTVIPDGIFYAYVKGNFDDAGMFINANAKFKTTDNFMFAGNAQLSFSLGRNFDAADPAVPAEVKYAFDNYVPTAAKDGSRMDAECTTGKMVIPKQNGSIGFNIFDIFTGEFTMGFNGNGEFRILTKYLQGTYTIDGTATADLNGSAKIMGFDVGGFSINGSIVFNGSYDKQALKWNASGRADPHFVFYTSGGGYLSCNTIGPQVCWAGGFFPWPCPVYKACFNAAITLKCEQGSQPSVAFQINY